MKTFVRFWMVLLVITSVGSALLSCSNEDCWNNCAEISDVCTQNCDNAFPSMTGPDWSACVAACVAELGVCQNECYPEDF